MTDRLQNGALAGIFFTKFLIERVILKGALENISAFENIGYESSSMEPFKGLP